MVLRFRAMSLSAKLEQISKQSKPLDVEERIRLNQLEVTIGKTLHSFLTCARALVEIRERQLWREKYRSFGDYAKLLGELRVQPQINLFARQRPQNYFFQPRAKLMVTHLFYLMCLR
jgi:hypothetical protein